MSVVSVSCLKRRSWLTLSVAALGAAMLLTSGCSGAQEAGDALVQIDAARADHEAGRVTLIDIREPSEHATGVAAGARLLPMSQLNQRVGEIPNDPSKPVLLICNTQNRSRSVAQALRERGYKNVQYVKGGMSEWVRRGWPVVKPGA